jgi:hypothetical protein
MNATLVRGDVDLRHALAAVAHARIFFAHRSVGADLMSGVAAVADGAGGDTVRVLEVVDELPHDTFGHALLPDSGDPLAKLRDFELMLQVGSGSVADIAMFKFCYTDITARSDAAWLFRMYDRTVRGLRAAHRHVTFVHVTTPLTAVRPRGGARAALRGMLRRAPEALIDNARRGEFNDLMRRAYRGREPLFDLAHAESTAPNGARELHDLHGWPIAALVPDYTTDGGHLNAYARVRIATELIATLAPLAVRP